MYTTEEYKIIGRYKNMIHVVHKSLKIKIDSGGVYRIKNKPYDIVGVWIDQSMLIDNNIQLTLF